MMEFTVEFDFEDYIRSINDARPKLKIAPTDTKARTVVCIHWLQGLCQKGETCEFLHKLDKSKMPVCKHGKQCRKKNCPKKHETDEEKDECPFFLQGFCLHGPFCKFRHVKRAPDECPDVVQFEELMNSTKKRKAAAPNQSYKHTLCKHWLEKGTCPFADGCIFAHGEEDIKGSYYQDDANDPEVYDPVGFKMDNPLVLPYPISPNNTSFFILQAPDLVTLLRAKKRGVWAVSEAIARDINSAKEKVEHVLLYFSVLSLTGIYGVAELASGQPIIMPSAPGQLSAEFSIRWLKTFRLSIKTICQHRMSNGMHLSKLDADGRLDSSSGSEITLMTYRKPEWDWTAELLRAQLGGRNTLSAQEIKAAIEKENSDDPEVRGPLFSPQWIEKTTRGPLFGGLSGAGRFPFHGGGAGATAAMIPRGPGPAPAVGLPVIGGDYYPGVIPGFVVGCTTDMLDECFNRRLFGLPVQLQGEAMQSIRPGTPLYLQDVNSGVMHGLFEAVSPAVFMMEPQAFTGGFLPESRYPVQVRFQVVLEAPMINELDPEIMQLFGGKKAGERIGPINLGITKRLSNLFAMRAGAWAPPAAASVAAPAPFLPPPLSRQQHQGPPGVPFQGKVHTAMYKPPFPIAENVIVGIPIYNDGGQLKRRLLGPQSSNILHIINSVGTPTTLKIRLRGIGSGFREGSELVELQEPLQFCVSADKEETMHQAAAKVRELIAAAAAELGVPPGGRVYPN